MGCRAEAHPATASQPHMLIGNKHEDNPQQRLSLHMQQNLFLRASGQEGRAVRLFSKDSRPWVLGSICPPLCLQEELQRFQPRQSVFSLHAGNKRPQRVKCRSPYVSGRRDGSIEEESVQVQGRETLLPGLPEIRLGILYLHMVWEGTSRTEGVLNSGGRGGVRGRNVSIGRDMVTMNTHNLLSLSQVPGAALSTFIHYSFNLNNHPLR